MATARDRRPNPHDELAVACGVEPSYWRSVPAPLERFGFADHSLSALGRKAANGGRRMECFNDVENVLFTAEVGGNRGSEVLDVRKFLHLALADRHLAEGSESFADSVGDERLLVTDFLTRFERPGEFSVFFWTSAAFDRPRERFGFDSSSFLVDESLRWRPEKSGFICRLDEKAIAFGVRSAKSFERIGNLNYRFEFGFECGGEDDLSEVTLLNSRDTADDAFHPLVLRGRSMGGNDSRRPAARTHHRQVCDRLVNGIETGFDRFGSHVRSVRRDAQPRPVVRARELHLGQDEQRRRKPFPWRGGCVLCLERETTEHSRTSGGWTVRINVGEQLCGVLTERIEPISTIRRERGRRAASDEFEAVRCRPRDPWSRLV